MSEIEKEIEFLDRRADEIAARLEAVIKRAENLEHAFDMMQQVDVSDGKRIAALEKRVERLEAIVFELAYADGAGVQPTYSEYAKEGIDEIGERLIRRTRKGTNE